MQATLHQEFALAFADERDGLRRRRLAVRRVDERVTRNVEPRFVGDFLDFRPGSNQNRDDDAGFSGLDRAPERSLVAGMDDDCRRRRRLLRPCDQPLVFLVAHMNRPVGFEHRHDNQDPLNVFATRPSTGRNTERSPLNGRSVCKPTIISLSRYRGKLCGS